MNIEKLKTQISSMTDEELENKFQMYSEIESRDVYIEVVQELIAIELDNRELV